LLLEAGEAILEGLAVLVRGVFGESRRTSSLQESRLADLALDIHSLLIDLELRLCDLGIFVLAITLGGCLRTVSHFDWCGGCLTEGSLGV